MSTHEMALNFDQFGLTTKAATKTRAFRIVLLPGELLRVPRQHGSLRVVSGTAWVSHRGTDHALRTGDVLPLQRASHEALVSAEGETLFLEIA